MHAFNHNNGSVKSVLCFFCCLHLPKIAYESEHRSRILTFAMPQKPAIPLPGWWQQPQPGVGSALRDHLLLWPLQTPRFSQEARWLAGGCEHRAQLAFFLEICSPVFFLFFKKLIMQGCSTWVREEKTGKMLTFKIKPQESCDLINTTVSSQSRKKWRLPQSERSNS